MDRSPLICGLRLVVALSLPATASAHPHTYIDQQVQLSVGIESVDMTVAITPSMADGAAVFSHIDVNGDGAASREEAQLFGADVLAAAKLTVDGQVFVFAQVEVSVPSAERAAEGIATFIIKASTQVRMTAQDPHRVEFGISYEAFSHDWFVQPFYHPSLLESMPLPAVDRTGGGGKVVIRLNSP